MKDFASGGHPEEISSVSKIKISHLWGNFCLPASVPPPTPPFLLLRERKETKTGFLFSIQFAHFQGATIQNLGLTVWIKPPFCQ
jgi:hypothetical protein